MITVNIQGNTAGVSGGGFYGSSSTTLTLQGKQYWTDNIAGIAGGGMVLLTSTMMTFSSKVLSSLNLQRNIAKKGSAMFLSDVTMKANDKDILSSILLWSMNISDNTAFDAGTIYWYKNDIIPTEPAFISSRNVTWSNNQVGVYGERAATQTTKITVPDIYYVTIYGEPLNPPLTIGFSDYYGQQIGSITNSHTVQISIVNYENNTCTFAALAGDSVINGGVPVINGIASFPDLSVRCAPNGLLHVGLTATIDELEDIRGETYSLTEVTSLIFRDCVAGEYEKEGECVLCPIGTYKNAKQDRSEECGECLTTEGVDTCYGSVLVLKKGYYRRSPEHETILQCPLGTNGCIGGNMTGESLCSMGYAGELCSCCDNGYFSNGWQCITCNKSNYFTIRTIVFLAICGVLIILIITMFVKKIVPSLYSAEGAVKIWWQDVITKGKLIIATFQIIASAVEILQVVYPKIFVVFVEAISVINPQIFTLVSAVQCARKIPFTKRLLWVTVIPIIIVVLLMIICKIHIWIIHYLTRREAELIMKNASVPADSNQQCSIISEDSKESPLDDSVDDDNQFDKYDEEDSQGKGKKEPIPGTEQWVIMMTDKHTRNIQDNYFNGMLIFSYLILPSVSTTIFRMFLCTNVDPNHEDNYPTDYYLTADMSISCEDVYYRDWVAYAALMVIVYPIGIPCFYAWLLRKHSQAIKHHHHDFHHVHQREHQRILAKSSTESKEKLRPSLRRQQHATTIFPSAKELVPPPPTTAEDEMALQFANRIRFLWSAYEAEYWYWEVIECTRRILLTAVLSVIYPGTALQSLFGMVFAIFYIKLYGTYHPYLEDSDDAIAEFSQYQIFFVYLAGLIIGNNLVGSNWNKAIGILLVGMNIFIIVYTVRLHIHEMKTFQQEAEELQDVIRKHSEEDEAAKLGFKNYVSLRSLRGLWGSFSRKGSKMSTGSFFRHRSTPAAHFIDSKNLNNPGFSLHQASAQEDFVVDTGPSELV